MQATLRRQWFFPAMPLLESRRIRRYLSPVYNGNARLQKCCRSTFDQTDVLHRYIGYAKYYCCPANNLTKSSDLLILPFNHNIVDGNESDGAWSQWTLFSSCSTDSGGCKRSRNRTCDAPPPTAKGLPCSGDYQETEDCAPDACPVK